LAVLGLLERLPDLIVSGINDGLNLGRDVSYSGTVAAAMEGVRVGVPAIAVSLDTASDRSEAPDYSTAAQFAARFAQFLMKQEELPKNIVLNVNVPYAPAGRKLESRVTRLGGEAYSNYLVTGKDPQGRNYYWVTGDPLTKGSHESESTDIGAISAGFVSITPIHLDMTEHALLEPLGEWIDTLNQG
jgi:5'-nucleotidase